MPNSCNTWVVNQIQDATSMEMVTPGQLKQQSRQYEVPKNLTVLVYIQVYRTV